MALLAEDLAEAKPHLLDAAIARWVGFRPFLPKASELIAIMEAIAAESTPPDMAALDAHCDYLNGLHFTKETRTEWFVNSRTREDGATERFCDRRPIREGSSWKPAPGEVEAIQAKIAKLVASGMTQAEFNRLVDERRT